SLFLTPRSRFNGATISSSKSAAKCLRLLRLSLPPFFSPSKPPRNPSPNSPSAPASSPRPILRAPNGSPWKTPTRFLRKSSLHCSAFPTTLYLPNFPNALKEISPPQNRNARPPLQDQNAGANKKPARLLEPAPNPVFRNP